MEDRKALLNKIMHVHHFHETFQIGNADAPTLIDERDYILFGTVLKHGLQHKIEEVFDEIQRSNMSKLDEQGQPIFREDGKILKSNLYFRPNIKDILEK